MDNPVRFWWSSRRSGMVERRSTAPTGVAALTGVVVALVLFVAACGTSNTTPTASPAVDGASGSTTNDADPGDAAAAADDGPSESEQPTSAAVATTDTEPPPVESTQNDTGDTGSASDTDEASDTEEPGDTDEASDEAGETQETGAVVDTASAEAAPVVFDNDFSASVQPIFVEKCASCHSAGGPGASHWVLGTAQDLVDTHLLIAEVVDSGYMPPWPASPESMPFLDDRSLRDDEIQAILDWSAAGAPLDVEASTPLPPPDGIIGIKNPDNIVEPPNAYAGDPNLRDDYRCQIYDPGFTDGGWITDYEFIPGEPSVVHHAIGYILPGSAREDAESIDGADGLPGWQCYGSSGLGADDIFLGWAPGQDATVFPDGAGLRFAPDEFIVLQVHYHYEGSAPADLSTLAINTRPASDDLREVTVSSMLAPVEIPCMADETGPLCDRDAAMEDAVSRYGSDGVNNDFANRICGVEPADFADQTDGLVSSSCLIPAVLVGATGEVVSVLGHMHEIGDWFRMTLNPGQPDEQVLLDIPDWDFDWQYQYRPAEPLVLDADDYVKIECGWDRGLRDPSLEPAYILWADGTNDEMCFATVTVAEPG